MFEKLKVNKNVPLYVSASVPAVCQTLPERQGMTGLLESTRAICEVIDTQPCGHLLPCPNHTYLSGIKKPPFILSMESGSGVQKGHSQDSSAVLLGVGGLVGPGQTAHIPDGVCT